MPNNPSTNGLGSLKTAALSDYTSNQNGQPNVPFLHSNEMLGAWTDEFSEGNPPLQPMNYHYFGMNRELEEDKHRLVVG